MAKKLTPLEKEVARAFEEAYKATGDWTGAYNKVLDTVGGKYDPEAFPREAAKRRAVGDALRRIQDGVKRKLKDPFTLAVDDAMKSLRRDNVVKAGQEAWDEQVEAAEKEGTSEEDIDEGPMLYVMFNDDGRYQSWTIDHPSYFQGHGGPTAAVSLPTSWDSIESEIGETLAQAEIWKE